MGCFSFICSVCGEAVRSNSQDGEHCTLYLLKKGKIIQQMTGQYDSYGNVYGDSWDKDWNDVVEMMFDGHHDTGICAVHTDCSKGHRVKFVPKAQSAPDPEQGCGEYKHSTKETPHDLLKND